MPAVAKELRHVARQFDPPLRFHRALQAALVDQIAQELATGVHSAVARLRDEKADPIDVVNAVFEAFSDGGAGQLISWLASTDNMDALKPLFKTIGKAVRELSADREIPAMSTLHQPARTHWCFWLQRSATR